MLIFLFMHILLCFQAAGGQISDTQAATMKRELAEQAARIKQLEGDLKQAEKSGLTGAISADVSDEIDFPLMHGV